MTRTGGAAVTDALASVGASVVFGVPGTHNLEIYRGLGAAGLTHVAPRHEQGAGYAADGWARMMGEPAVCLPTSGPGVTNLVTAVATAYADSVPMVVVAPGPPTGTGGADLGLLHELRDQRGVLASVVDGAVRPGTPEEAGRAVQEAFVQATSGRPRPQYVEVPVDVLEQHWDGSLGAAPVAEAPPAPSADDVRRAAESIAAAARPVLVVGGGCRGASAELSALAERLGCPVVTTVNGKGVLPEDHQLSLGASLRLPAAVRLLEDADVLLCVGTELGDSDLWEQRLEPRGAVVRVDVDPAQLHKNVAAEVAVLGDAREVLARLLDAVAAPEEPRWSAAGLAGARAELAADLERDGTTWRELQDAVRVAVDGDVVVAGDSAMVSYVGTVHHWPMGPRDRFLYPTGYATLGYGLPAAVGATLARPEVPAVVLVGDGGVMFTVQELATAVDLGASLPVVVVRNGGYGAIRDQMVERGIAPLGVDLTVPDLPTLARAFGAHGATVSDPADLTTAVSAALHADGPTVVEVWV